MNCPLVSTIIPTYNRPYFLKQAIQSVLAQNYENIEIIVVDDGSDIVYAENICAQFANCKYFYKKNGGLSSARNFGVSVSNGDFIAFLDDDDLFLSNKIQIQIEILLRWQDIDLVHSAALVIDGNGVETGQRIGASDTKAFKRSGYVFWNALGTWVVKSPTPLIRRKVFNNIRFDENIMVGEDIDFYQRLFYKHKVYYINEPLSYYRDNDNIERLSRKFDKYIGIESVLYSNLLKMGIKNPITLYRIALKLAQVGIMRINTSNNFKILNISKWKLYLNPFYYVKNITSLTQWK